MEFPGHMNWSHSLEAYRKLCEEAGVPSEDELATPASPTASACDEVANQLAHLGLPGRRRASHAGAGMAPRGAAPEIGGSMRMPGTEARVGRDNHFQSARMSYGPEPTRDSPEPYVPQPARHSSAQASYTDEADAAPRRESGIFSGLGKGLKKALGFSSSGKDFAGSASSASFRSDSRLRLDPHSPGRELPRSVVEEAPVDAEVTRHDSPPSEMPAPQAPRAPRRRRRDDEEAAIRRVAGASVRAEPTALPRLPLKSIKTPHWQDLALIERAREGLEASPDPNKGNTIIHTVRCLTKFSAWLLLSKKHPMQGRLFSDELTADAHKFADLGGLAGTPAALDHLRAMERSRTGTTTIPKRTNRKKKEVPAEDQALILRAFGAYPDYRYAAQTLSEWLSLNGHLALTAPFVDEDGQERGMHLLSDRMTQLVEEYLSSPVAQHKEVMRSVLGHLRTFQLQGVTNIRRISSHIGIPEVDVRLLKRYTSEAKRLAEASGKPLKEHKGQTSADTYATAVGAFSETLQKEGKGSVAARLHDPSLSADLELFADSKSSRFRQIRAALRKMREMFPPEDPDVTFGRIGHRLFVNALGMLALAPDMKVENAANSVAVDVDDLLVFLDARAEDGLTEAGRALVRTFDGPALAAASSAIGKRQRMMAETDGTAPPPGQALPPMQVTPVGSSQIGWSDAGATSHQDFGPAGSIQSDAHDGGHGFAAPQEAQPSWMADFDDLSSINSAGRPGGFGYELNEPSEEAQREQMDPAAFAGLSSIFSVPGYDEERARARSPSEVAGPSRPAHEIVDVDDYPSPAGQDTDFAQRLAHPTAWLQSDDLWNHSQEFLASFARELGRGGRARIDRMVSIGDPSVLVRHLLSGTARQREAARAQLTAPTLLLPVNNPHNHWSLLVVHRDARQATHYDSAISPDLARTQVAASTEQFALARQVAAALGIDAVGSMPMAQQHDAHSCGDHVLAGIETLARRLVTGQHEDLWNLSGIRPSRQHVIDTLTRAQAPELDEAVAAEWVHGDRYASPEVLHALATAGALPTEARPQTTLRIRGQRYEALLVDGNVWLHWTPARDRELSPGPAAMDRATLLGRLGVEMGNASGHGLNCLLDSIVQLANGTRRRRASVPELDGLVQTMREMLANVGVVDRHGQIDVYEGANAGALLAQTFQMRLQFIQDNGEDGVFVHPVIGHEGPLLRILHTPGHFQPLWPSRQR
ncbi:Ulp1 family isopeptidase [Roseateles sp. MS654]|uniref:Ulp1 family isopeptidase n=1 Tax=Roseateles sp. MS654 TaxID=3412685 RepID=UPI003C30403B